MISTMLVGALFSSAPLAISMSITGGVCVSPVQCGRVSCLCRHGRSFAVVLDGPASSGTLRYRAWPMSPISKFATLLAHGLVLSGFRMCRVAESPGRNALKAHSWAPWRTLRSPSMQAANWVTLQPAPQAVPSATAHPNQDPWAAPPAQSRTTDTAPQGGAPAAPSQGTETPPKYTEEPKRWTDRRKLD